MSRSPLNLTQFYRYGNTPLRLPDGNPVHVPEDAEPHEEMQPGAEAHCRIFRLWVPEDIAAYNTVLTAAARNWAGIHVEKHEFIAEHQSWLVLLAWVDWFLEPPRNAPITREIQGVTNAPSTAATVYGQIENR